MGVTPRCGRGWVPITHRSQSSDQGESTPSGRRRGDASTRERLTATLQDDEQPAYLLESDTGPIERDRGARTERYDIAPDATAAAAVTDRRVVLYVPQSGARATRDQRFPIHFTDIERVGLDDPADPSTLSIRLPNGDRWAFPVGGVGSETVAEATRYVRKGAGVYTRAQSAAETVHESRGDLLTPALQREGWDLASDRYTFLTARIEDAREQAASTPFSDAPALTETIDTTERTVESAYTRALLARIETVCRTGRQAFEDEDVETGRTCIETATEHYGAALCRVEQYGLDPFDAPPFGGAGVSETDAETLAADGIAEAMGLAVDQVASLCERATARAQRATAAVGTVESIGRPEETIATLETAFSLYRTVLYACWGREELLPLERPTIQRRVESVAARLIEAHRRVAERAEWAGSAARADGDIGRAIESYDRALAQFEAAHSLAGQFRAGDAAFLAAERERVAEMRRDLPRRATRRD